MPLNAAALAENFNRAIVAQRFGVETTDPLSLIVLAKADPENPVALLDVRFDTFDSLQKAGIIEQSGTALTERGKEMVVALRQTMPVSMFAGVSLQNTIRNFRSDMDAIARAPEDFRWFMRHMMYRFRLWWAGTNPATRPIMDGGELKPVKLWSERDERAQYKQWVESHYSAFWLCPDGVEEGIRLLDAFNTKCKADGVTAQVLDAVGDIARMATQLPLKPKQIEFRQATPEEIAEKYREKYADEFDDINAFAESTLWKVVEQRLSKPGVGKTYSVSKLTGEQQEAFIRVFDNKVDAVESAIELANKEADAAVKKLNRRKPKQFVLIDDFCKTFDELSHSTGKSISEIARANKTSVQATAARIKSGKPKPPSSRTVIKH